MVPHFRATSQKPVRNVSEMAARAPWCGMVSLLKHGSVWPWVWCGLLYFTPAFREFKHCPFLHGVLASSKISFALKIISRFIATIKMSSSEDNPLMCLLPFHFTWQDQQHGMENAKQFWFSFQPIAYVHLPTHDEMIQFLDLRHHLQTSTHRK